MPFLRLAGGSIPTALLRNRGRLRAALSRKIEAHLRRRLTAILQGKSQLHLSSRTAPWPISLTSWRPRLPALSLTLLTLLEQSRRPSAIVVWLAPADAPFLQREIRELFESFGVEFRLSKDLGPHKKWLPMIQSGASHPFVICDDDTIYPRHWLESLLADVRPDCYVGCRCHRITLAADETLGPYSAWEKEIAWEGRPSHLIFVTGVGGAIIHPDRLPPEFLDEAAIMRLCPRADDIWLHLAHRHAGVPGFKTRYSFPCLNLPGTESSGLAHANVDQCGNDRQLAAALNHFQMDFSQVRRPQTPSGVTCL